LFLNGKKKRKRCRREKLDILAYNFPRKKQLLKTAADY
jgi:hypothetical protein